MLDYLEAADRRTELLPRLCVIKSALIKRAGGAIHARAIERLQPGDRLADGALHLHATRKNHLLVNHHVIEQYIGKPATVQAPIAGHLAAFKRHKDQGQLISKHRRRQHPIRAATIRNEILPSRQFATVNRQGWLQNIVSGVIVIERACHSLIIIDNGLQYLQCPLSTQILEKFSRTDHQIDIGIQTQDGAGFPNNHRHVDQIAAIASDRLRKRQTKPA